MVIVSIIGTSNRVTPPSIDNILYNKMIDKCKEIIDSLENPDSSEGVYDHSDITLISGGAAFSDHIAVSLYLLDQDYKELILYIPCNWNNEYMKYVEPSPIEFNKFSTIDITEDPLNDFSDATTSAIPSKSLVKPLCNSTSIPSHILKPTRNFITKSNLVNSNSNDTTYPLDNSIYTTTTTKSTTTANTSNTKNLNSVTNTNNLNSINNSKTLNNLTTNGRKPQQPPSNTLNYYHEQFSKVIQSSSFEQIKMAISIGAIINNDYPGFWNRDNMVAKSSDVMIAFSWSKTSYPTQGGTQYTWKKANSKCKKIHVSLYDLLDQ